MKNLLKKVFAKLIRKYRQRLRIFIYKTHSAQTVHLIGNPIINQPVVFQGLGTISFGEKVFLGYPTSPGFYSETAYIEARKTDAVIKFGNNIYINNTITIIADGGNISIGDEVLIGDHVRIINSDFHGLDPKERNSGTHLSEDIEIGKNVFIGSGVSITKGVTIGENSVIGVGSVVINNIPSNCIAAGVPAKKIKDL